MIRQRKNLPRSRSPQAPRSQPESFGPALPGGPSLKKPRKKKNMKEVLRNALLVCGTLLFTVTLCVAGSRKPAAGTQGFEIGLTTHYFDYEEKGIMQETGFMHGIVGNYRYHGTPRLMAHATLEACAGGLDYDGHLQDGTPFQTTTDDWIVECRGLIGYGHPLSGGYLLTPYTGIGYRYWNDDISSSAGYEREIHYGYVPLGVKTVGPLSAAWTWGLTAEYDLFCGGSVKSHLSEAEPRYNDPVLDQEFGDGYGLRGSLFFQRTVAAHCALAIEPFITYWDIDPSNTGPLYRDGKPFTHVIEPKNETLAYGLRLHLSL